MQAETPTGWEKYSASWDSALGCILNNLTSAERQAAYACDITYATNNELGFDYLRDNMVVRIENLVQRGLHYAIIDEVDSILIDEARTPLIISGSGSKSTQLYEIADSFVKALKKGKILNEDDALNPLIKEEIKEEGDFVVDEKAKSVTLTRRALKRRKNSLISKTFPTRKILKFFIILTTLLRQTIICLKTRTMLYRMMKY